MTHNPSNPQLVRELTDAEIALRKRWLEFENSDEEMIVSELDKLVGNNVDQLIESMYAHFLSFDETRSFFPNEHVLKHAQRSQKDYFLRFTKGHYDAKYVADRLGVGSTHHRIDLDPKWYIGAYNRVLNWFLPKVVTHFCSTPERLIKALSALMKLIFFDMGLAIECYIAAKEHSIRQHRDAIRELELERNVTKAIVENAPTGIVSLSENLICLECNEEFVKIVNGADRASVIGRELFKVAPGLPKSQFMKALTSGQTYRTATENLNITGTAGADATYWDWAVWPVKDGNRITGLVSMFANVSDRVMLYQQREDFVATLTHDLKTPVLAANRAVGYLIDGDFGPLVQEQKEILQTVLQSNNALYSLVQTLLDVYKFDSGMKEFYMQSCDISAVICRIVSEIMPLAQDRGVTLESDIEVETYPIYCDEAEIRRVIQNLIDNALKFTPSGGKILVSMRQKEEKTTITVSDTGKGIPDENKPKLFQRFWQAGSTGRYYASTGLGLYLCRRIIDGHEGRIWCESTIGQGSKFFVELPREPSSASAVAT